MAKHGTADTGRIDASTGEASGGGPQQAEETAGFCRLLHRIRIAPSSASIGPADHGACSCAAQGV